MILFADDFMGYGTDVALLRDGLWGSATATIQNDPDTNAPAGTKVLQFSGTFNQALRPFVTGPVDLVGCALRLWMPQLPGFTTGCIRFFDVMSQLQTNLCILPNGGISVVNGSNDHGGEELGRLEIPVLTANAWHHIEFKVFCNEISGYFEVRVDGATVLEGENLDTGTAAQLGLGTTNDYNGSAARTDNIKDLVVWCGLGTQNVDFLGTVSVIGLTPNADLEEGWTPSTGTEGWPLLDNSPPLDNTAYITAPYPAPPPSSFALSPLPLNVTSVRAMIMQVRARKVDGGDGKLQNSLISEGDIASGIDRPITTAFTYYEDVIETDPATDAAWTPAAAESAEFQVDRTL